MISGGFFLSHFHKIFIKILLFFYKNRNYSSGMWQKRNYSSIYKKVYIIVY